MRRPMHTDMMANQTSPTLALLRESGEAETRENFIELLYGFLGGEVPNELDAEIESEFPEQFQQSTLAEAEPEEGIQ
jgi:hypothetical protein